MKACDIENTFTTRKIYEIANSIAGRTLPPKKSECIKLICQRFSSMTEVYQHLIDTSYTEHKFYGIGLKKTQ